MLVSINAIYSKILKHPPSIQICPEVGRSLFRGGPTGVPRISNSQLLGPYSGTVSKALWWP